MKIPPPDFPHLYEAVPRPHLEHGAHAGSRLTALDDPGLPGLRERVEKVGGSLRIGTTHGEGTKITERIPVSKTAQGKWHEGYAENQPEIT